MSKWLKGMIVVTFVLVLAMAAFLLWTELREPRQAAAVKAEPVVDAGATILKTEAQWVENLEKKYHELKVKLNDKRWAEAIEHYGCDVVLFSRALSKEFKGGREIVEDYWKPQLGKAPAKKNVEFNILKVNVFPANFCAVINGKAVCYNQIVFYQGMLTTEASPAESSDFYGVAGHIQSCPDIILSEVF